MVAGLVFGLAGAVFGLVQTIRLRKALEGKRSAEGKNVGLEAAIEAKRREYVRALETIGACEDPAAIRYLAHRLLNDPWYGDVPAPADP